jgi:hypothetical protein
MGGFPFCPKRVILSEDYLPYYLFASSITLSVKRLKPPR